MVRSFQTQGFPVCAFGCPSPDLRNRKVLRRVHVHAGSFERFHASLKKYANDYLRAKKIMKIAYFLACKISGLPVKPLDIPGVYVPLLYTYDGTHEHACSKYRGWFTRVGGPGSVNCIWTSRRECCIWTCTYVCMHMLASPGQLTIYINSYVDLSIDRSVGTDNLSRDPDR